MEEPAGTASPPLDDAAGRAAAIVAEAEEQARQILKEADQLRRSAWRVRLQGYLAKHKGVSWQRRFCVLRGNLILYYPNHWMCPDYEPKGVFDLEGATLLADLGRERGRPATIADQMKALVANEAAATPHQFVVTRPNGVRWMFSAESDAVARTWIHAILDTGCVAFEDADPRRCAACGATTRGSAPVCRSCALPLPAPVPRALPARPAAASLASSAMHNGTPVAGSLARSVAGVGGAPDRRLGGRAPSHRGGASTASSVSAGGRPRTPPSRRSSDAQAGTQGTWALSSLLGAQPPPSAPEPEDAARRGAPAPLPAGPAPSAPPAEPQGAQGAQGKPCASCAAALRATAKFCHSCGAAQPAPAAAPGADAASPAAAVPTSA